MKFVYKCFLQRLFSYIPYGEVVNYAFQRYMTRSLPVSDAEFLRKVNLAYSHYSMYVKYYDDEKNDIHYYEFGAGWDLITPITMGLLGCKVTCSDIRRLVFNELIQDTISKFYLNRDNIPFSLDPDLVKIQKTPPLEYIRKNLNVHYYAPCDSRSTPFPANHFNFVSSTVTLEHIPLCDIESILAETHRIMMNGGVFSLIIDYKDHWSYFDSSISIYNFLKYSEKEWKRFNPALHFQNRLRHRDYLDIISRSGFKILEIVPEFASNDEIRELEQLNINMKYDGYSVEELSIKGAHIVLKK